MAQKNLKLIRIRYTATIGTIFAGMVCAILLTISIMQNDAKATTSTIEYKKALATALSVCVDTKFKDEVKVESFNSAWSGGVNAIVSSNSKVAYPAGYDGTAINKGCQDIFSEALQVGGVSLSVPADELETVMKSLGYESSGSSSSGQCMQLKYLIGRTLNGVESSHDQLSKAICIEDIDANGVIQSASPTIVANGGSSMVVEFKAKTGKVNIDCNVGWFGEGGCGDVTYNKGVTTWEEFKNAIWQKILTSEKGVSGKGNLGLGSADDDFNYALYVEEGLIETSYGAVTAVYTKTADAATTMSQKLLGVSDYAFKPFEIMALYQTALVNYYEVSAIDPTKLSDDEKTLRLGNSSTEGGYIESRVISNGRLTTCYIKATKNTNRSIPAVGENNIFAGFARYNGVWVNTPAATINVQGILDWMKNSSVSSSLEGAMTLMTPNIDCSEVEYSADDAMTPGGTTVESPDGSTDSDPDPCGDGVGSLGWILCPVVNLLSKNVQEFYNNYLQQNFLEVNSSWLGSSTDLYTNGWSQFRNYANIVLAIILIIVVLSQITGFGVTNYGIKKMLPRIVVMAILINISFFICQLAVDISNILGYSINKLFVNMSVDFGGSSAAAGGGSGWLNTLSIAGLGLTGLTIGQWIVPLLLALLTSLISVAFAGIILGIRQAGVLILVVISPLAFACYAFDGTKSWFDKWRKLFVNLLVVFPVCGLLMGGGVYASSLLGNAPSAGVFIKLIAVMLKVGAFGRGLRGSAARIGRASDLYQLADTGAGVIQGKGMRGVKGLIGRTVKKIPGGDDFAKSKFGQWLGRRGNRRIARYAQKEYNLVASEAAANAIAEGGFLDAERRGGMEAAAREKAEMQGTDEQQALYRTKLGEAGVASDTTLKKEIEKIQEEFNQRPQDVTLRRKLKALTKFLLDFDDGRGELVKQYHKLITDSPTSASAQAMNAFLNRGENMGVIKSSGQRGLQQMIQDKAQGKDIGSLAHYTTTKADKPDANMVGRIDSSFLKAQYEAMKTKEKDTFNNEERENMSAWLNLYQEAMANQHTRGNINQESKKLIEQITEEAEKHNIFPTLNVPR